jgi:thymidine phosphorylase
VAQARQTLAQGKALETLRRMVSAQQGQPGRGEAKLEQLLAEVEA